MDLALFDLKYSDKKIHANSKGYKVQIRVLGESTDERKIKHAFKNIETAYSVLDGDNRFTVSHVKTKRGMKKCQDIHYLHLTVYVVVRSSQPSFLMLAEHKYHVLNIMP